MNPKVRWQDWFNVIIGGWLIVAPLIGIGQPDGTEAVNAWISGGLVILFSVWALARPEKWEEWVNLALGLWIMAAPFVLGFSDSTLAAWNHVVVGVIIVGDAIWAAGQRARPPGTQRPTQ